MGNDGKLRVFGGGSVTVAGTPSLGNAVHNLEMLAGLFTHLNELAGLFGPETLKLFNSTTLGTLAPLGWALQVLAGPGPDARWEFVEKTPGDAWRAAAELMGATIDFVQGFLERWRGGVLGEVTAEVLTAGVVGPVSTFKAKRIRREHFLDANDAGRLETVQVDGEAQELLVLDALLADMFDGLGQATTAATVPSTCCCARRRTRSRRVEACPRAESPGHRRPLKPGVFHLSLIHI